MDERDETPEWAIDLKGVSVRYGSQVVLADVDLVVGGRGPRSVAIAGPSGSGKSTLLAVISGLVRPSVGSVVAQYGGRVVKPASLGSWVLQTTNVLPRRTAIDNVALGALAGRTRAEALDLARHALSRVGLTQLSNRPARLMSGGEVQRICIARAAATGRPVMFLDEPTGQLDKAATELIVDYLRELSVDVSLIVASHDQTVLSSCDHIYAIEDGRLRST